VQRATSGRIGEGGKRAEIEQRVSGEPVERREQVDGSEEGKKRRCMFSHLAASACTNHHLDNMIFLTHCGKCPDAAEK
jgi:hypothetical protein